MSGAAFAQEKIKVGVTATLEGTYTVLGEDGIRGFQTALNNSARSRRQGTRIRHCLPPTATPDSAVRAVRKPDRAGQGADPAFTAIRRRRYCGQEFRQAAPELTFVNALPARRKQPMSTRAKLLPLQHGWRQWQVGSGQIAY